MSAPTNYGEIKRLLKDRTRFVAVGENAVEELGLQYRDAEDLHELRYILGGVLAYPSTEVAELHRDAHKMGMYDVKYSALDEEDKQRYGKVRPFPFRSRRRTSSAPTAATSSRPRASPSALRCPTSTTLACVTSCISRPLSTWPLFL